MPSDQEQKKRNEGKLAEPGDFLVWIWGREGRFYKGVGGKANRFGVEVESTGFSRAAIFRLA